MILAIVQARMGSSRLPGKVLKPVLGRPLISFLLERLQRTESISDIIVATSTESSDIPIAHVVEQLGIKVFRGSENDLLERYYKAYSSYENKDQVRGIVRITADCPLVDPDIINSIIEIFQSESKDYVTTSSKSAEGLDVEVFRPALLIEAYENAKRPSEREHLTQYFHNNSDKFSIAKFDTGEDLSRYRVTVDEKEDFEVVKSILENIYPQNPQFSFLEVRKYLDSHPDVYQLNSQIVRNEGLAKSLAAERKVNSSGN